MDANTYSVHSHSCVFLNLIIEYYYVKFWFTMQQFVGAKYTLDNWILLSMICYS